SPGVATSSLKDVAVNGWVEAEGTLNADGSLSASVVRILPGMPGPGRRGGFGGRGGPRGAPGGGAPGGAPASTPAPSGTSG
ncbi:MAG TPA: hypothetical protein VNF73_12485, partial [Candidatus Saccharimonadales bacterium]|nr:hypothetical protein [Candidatus Saccharimonadales bacterium]